PDSIVRWRSLIVARTGLKAKRQSTNATTLKLTTCARMAGRFTPKRSVTWKSVSLSWSTMPPLAGAVSAAINRTGSMAEEGWPRPSGERGGRTRLLDEEDRVERDGLGERHADDGLDENLAGRAGIAADALDGLGADETDADGG